MANRQGITLYWTFANFYTLCQAYTLKQPFVKRFLDIPTPPRAPNPKGFVPQPPPTLMDTFREVKAKVLNSHKEALEGARARANTNGNPRAVVSDAARRNTALEQNEVIIEHGGGSMLEEPAVVKSADTITTTPLSNSTQARQEQVKSSPVLRAVAAKRSEKEERVAAARARRAKR